MVPVFLMFVAEQKTSRRRSTRASSGEQSEAITSEKQKDHVEGGASNDDKVSDLVICLVCDVFLHCHLPYVVQVSWSGYGLILKY